MASISASRQRAASVAAPPTTLCSARCRRCHRWWDHSLIGLSELSACTWRRNAQSRRLSWSAARPVRTERTQPARSWQTEPHIDIGGLRDNATGFGSRWSPIARGPHLLPHALAGKPLPDGRRPALRQLRRLPAAVGGLPGGGAEVAVQPLPPRPCPRHPPKVRSLGGCWA